ncbi:MAG: alanine--tRNA ligase [Proteobacteria bacterium]|nr:alanine--tRNA ligase [Pseudomonadota bacterium]
MTGNEARQLFLDYFKNKHHQIVRSSSLVPHDDPTLLFVNAGMVQFKRTFMGEDKRNYVTASTAQKCVRAGGKHNDLENVGYTARHHTFFEMLGNFSFGDYFKEKAIFYAWDLLTTGYKLPVDKLWVSIFLDDDEAFNIWHKVIGVPENRIIRLGEKDNFWAMGDTGPCGPCSEIHIDRGEAHGCGKPDCAVGCDCDRFLEIWNLVFMQFNKDESGKLNPLPKPSIDTGMGLERITSVVQNVATNYDTDLFLPIIKKVETLSGVKLGTSSTGDVAMKVIADHSRAAAFLIGDGILPSNEGRGYVLRRIMRRAIRYGRQIGLDRPFLHETAQSVLDIMKSAYPELSEARSFIANVITNEEKNFSTTLDNGLKLLDGVLSDLNKEKTPVIPGDLIFKLYDTFGFPVDIIKDVIKGRSIGLDMDGFNKAMEKQRAQSRSTTTFTAISDAYKTLSSSGIKSSFKGYDTLSLTSDIMLIVKDGKDVDQASTGDHVEIVTKDTPFYAASGGQTGDSGIISVHGEKGEVTVTDTAKDPTGLIIHHGKVTRGTVKKTDSAILAVDEGKRKATALNHTATHILHAALRNILGDHVKQAGSMVSSERLRFDFSHFSQIDRRELDAIEHYVNQRIRDNAIVETQEMDAEDAFKTGATALFEEKYGDRVRVVALDSFSKEFCGGTHTTATGNIGLFKILHETSIAAGIRRIEALTGNAALDFVQSAINRLNQAAYIVKDKPETVVQRIEKLLSDQKALEKELEKIKSQMASKAVDSIDDDIKIVNSTHVVVKNVNVDNPAGLRELADKFRDKIKSGVIVLGAVSGEKVLLISVVTKDLTGKYHAGNIIKKVAGIVGGSGGGRPDMAQAGGSEPAKLDQALQAVIPMIADGV